MVATLTTTMTEEKGNKEINRELEPQDWKEHTKAPSASGGPAETLMQISSRMFPRDTKLPDEGAMVHVPS